MNHRRFLQLTLCAPEGNPDAIAYILVDDIRHVVKSPVDDTSTLVVESVSDFIYVRESAESILEALDISIIKVEV